MEVQLKKIERELQAFRNNWLCVKGFQRRHEIFIYNKPYAQNNPKVPMASLLEMAVNNLPSRDLVKYVCVGDPYSKIGLNNVENRDIVLRSVRCSFPKWTVISPVLDGARIHFFTRLAADADSLDVIREAIVRDNRLNDDEETQVLSFEEAHDDQQRICMSISHINREKILDQDGIVRYMDRHNFMYDDIRLGVCEKCHSFKHVEQFCDSYWKCLHCLGEHYGVCPLQNFPGKRLCASCPANSAYDHTTFSIRCPSLIKRVHQLLHGINFDYEWICIPPNPLFY